MMIESEIKVSEYEIVATVQFFETPGEAIVGHNGGSHYIVAVRPPESDIATLVMTIPYDERTAKYRYIIAVQEAGKQAAMR